MTARDDARQAFEHRSADVLELALDFCNNSYGISPCEAGLVTTGTAQAGSTSSITLAASDTAESNEYIDFLVYIESGTGATQAAFITDYVSSTKVATAVFAIAPDNTSVYRIHRVNGNVVHKGAAFDSGFNNLAGALTAVPVADFYNGMKVRMLTGQFAGEIRDITDYTAIEDTLSQFTVSPRWSLAEGPNAGDQYIVVDETLKANCYNTFHTCQDKANFSKGTKTYKYVSRGTPIPHGELLRPYIDKLSPASTNIEPDKGLATRSRLTVECVDDVTSDIGMDPYPRNRLNDPGGTHWGRQLARNPFYAGRFGTLRRGYVVEPWDWNTFIDELYIIDSISGQAKNGAVTITLVDPLKLSDRTKLPLPTDGKLTHELKASEANGTAVSATSTTIVLDANASAVDDAYLDMHIRITGGKGPNQERAITAYVGATRTATVATWDITPDNTSTYDIQRVKITLATGEGAQYADPVATGKRQFIALGKEIIEYTLISGDVLSWPAISYRQQFGSTLSDHKVNANVQYCLSFIEQSIAQAIKTILNTSGIADANIDLTLLNDQNDTWLGVKYTIHSAVIHQPTKPADLLKELCVETNAVMYWDNTAQKVKFKVVAPQPPMGAAAKLLNDESGLINKSVSVTPLDDLRITRAVMRFDLLDATETLSEARNFGDGIRRIDTDAEGPNEYGDIKPFIIYSRWLDDNNRDAVLAWTQRKLLDRRDAPIMIKAKIDTKDYDFPVGEMIDIETSQLPDFTGAPKRIRCLVTKLTDRGANINIELLSSRFDERYGFIAPNGYPDYAAASEAQRLYAFIADNDGLMSDGTEAYKII